MRLLAALVAAVALAGATAACESEPRDYGLPGSVVRFAEVPDTAEPLAMRLEGDSGMVAIQHGFFLLPGCTGYPTSAPARQGDTITFRLAAPADTATAECEEEPRRMAYVALIGTFHPGEYHFRLVQEGEAGRTEPFDTSAVLQLLPPRAER